MTLKSHNTIISRITDCINVFNLDSNISSKSTVSVISNGTLFHTIKSVGYFIIETETDVSYTITENNQKTGKNNQA